VTRRRGRRCKELLNELKEKKYTGKLGIEGKVEERKKVTRRQGRRCKELLNVLKEKKDTGELGEVEPTDLSQDRLGDDDDDDNNDDIR
jgi:hypothetical protein